jgi:hypothetical protein
MRYALISALALCAVAAQALPQQEPTKRKIPCKTPENASTCYWTHGRLAVYNGNPAWRIWKIGTKRILGVYSGPNSWVRDPLDNEHPEFPSNLDKMYEADYKRRVTKKEFDAEFPESAFGDFEVCLLEPERKGEMQAVCVESAKHIVLQPYVPRY